MASLAQINIRFAANLREFSTEMQSMQREFKKHGKAMQKAGKVMVLGITTPLVLIGKAAYGMAADFEDALGATDQIFKKASDATKQWADSLPTYYGIAKKEALEYSNMMGSMLVNIGNLTEEEASKQSAKLIELAGDLTAMYGGTTADAVRALTGSLKGNNTMLDNYGMAVNDALVKTKAYEMGLLKQGQALTLQAKQQATLALIYEQTGAAQGQAAREADGASGSIRALKTEITNLATEFGQELLPVITPVMQKIREKIVAIRDLNSEQKKWVVGVAAAVAVIGPLTLGLGKIITMIPNIVAGYKMIRTAVLAMNTAFMANPIIAVTAALAALTAGAILLESRLTPLVSAQKELDEVTQKATKSVAGEIAETRKLVAIAQNKKLSDEERTRALNKLIQKSDEHFGKLTLETIGTNEAKKATDNYTNSLLKNARVKAAQEKLVEVQRRKVELELGTSNEADPSVWQTIGNYGKSALKNAFNPVNNQYLYELEKFKSISENSKTVRKELDSLENQLLKIIGPQEEVTNTTEDYINTLNNTVTSIDDTKKAVQDLGAIGSVKWMRAQISNLEEMASKLDPTSTAYNNLTQQLKVYQNTLDSIQNPAETIFDGSEEWYSREIQLMETQLSKIDMMSDAYKNLKTQIEVMRKTMELMQSPVVDQTEPEQGTVDWYNYHINKLKEAQNEVGITIEEFKRLSQEISLLETTFKIQIEADEAVSTVESTVNHIKDVSDGLVTGLGNAFSTVSDNIVSSLGEAETGMDRFNQEMIKTVTKVLAMALSSAMANAIAGGSASGAATGPGAIVAIPTMIATLVAGVIGAFASIPKFANGGIVSGPTLGLMGEYAGAANNPEVIAPLNKLKELIEPAGLGNVTIQLTGGWKVQGNDLITVLGRQEKINQRRG